jgi:hypothetical protein
MLESASRTSLGNRTAIHAGRQDVSAAYFRVVQGLEGIAPKRVQDELSPQQMQAIHDAVRGYYDTLSLGVSTGLSQDGEGKMLLGPYRNLGKNARDEVEMTLGRAFRDGAFVQRLTTEILRACR